MVALLAIPVCRGIEPAGLRQVSIDAGATLGTLRSLAGVNGAPAPGMHKPENFHFGGWNIPEQVDATLGYRAANIDLVRTHDAYGPGDIDSRFESNAAPGGALISAARDAFTMFPDLNADPENPASYRFGPTDKLIASIFNIGAQAIFRLGRSEGADAQPPADFKHYANIVRHIVLHYNRGWANGFHYGIRYWEIWNEPDLGRVFWAGTAQQYFEFYSRLARAVKQADPTVLVGGPAIARPNDDSPYIGAFLQYVRSTRTPLDFYSWHWYASDSEDPVDFNRIAHTLRSRLDRAGLKHTRSFLTEWNSGLGDPPPQPMARAAFLTSSLIYMQDAPIDAATLYRADSVFGPEGLTPDETGRALIALGAMKATPLRLPVHGADSAGLAVQAGRSADGSLVRILISNYQVPAHLIGPRHTDNILHVPKVFDVRLLRRRTLSYRDNAGFELSVAHLPAAPSYVVDRCLIFNASGRQQRAAIAAGSVSSDSLATTAHGNDSPTPQTSEPVLKLAADGVLRIRAALPPPGVALISVRPGPVSTAAAHGSASPYLSCSAFLAK